MIHGPRTHQALLQALAHNLHKYVSHTTSRPFFPLAYPLWVFFQFPIAIPFPFRHSFAMLSLPCERFKKSIYSTSRHSRLRRRHAVNASCLGQGNNPTKLLKPSRTPIFLAFQDRHTLPIQPLLPFVEYANSPNLLLKPPCFLYFLKSQTRILTMFRSV